LERKRNTQAKVSEMLGVEAEKIIAATHPIDVMDLKELKSEYLKLHQSNKELFESFRCAASIQQGLLPQQRHFDRLFSDYFVLYDPQNIISGDFYWIGNNDGILYFAVSDCTGHGISGAMLSVLGISFLNYVVYSKDYTSLSDILCELDQKWLETFHIYADEEKDNNWMEMSLCSFDPKTRILKFAGARNKVVVISQEGEQVLYGERYPIGGWQIETERTYHQQEIRVPENSMVYLSTDGYKDQIGGPKDKTFKERKMREYLNELYYLPAKNQKAFLTMAFNEWKGDNVQTDDVCLLGVRL